MTDTPDPVVPDQPGPDDEPIPFDPEQPEQPEPAEPVRTPRPDRA